MSLQQNTVDQRRRFGRRIAQQRGQILQVRQIVVDGVHPVLPLRPAALADVGGNQPLPLALAHDAGHPAEPGRIPILAIDVQTVALTNLIEVIHPLPVLVIVGRLDADNGM